MIMKYGEGKIAEIVNPNKELDEETEELIKKQKKDGNKKELSEKN